MSKGIGSLDASDIIETYRSSLRDEEAERERSSTSIKMLEAAISKASQKSTLSKGHISVPTRPEKRSHHGRKRMDKSIREKITPLAGLPNKELPKFSRLHTVNAISDRAFLERNSKTKLMLEKKAEVVKARFCSRKSYLFQMLSIS